MLAVAVMAVHVGDVPGAGSVGFALAYATNSLLLAILWFRTGFHDPVHRSASNPYSTAYMLSAAVFVLSTTEYPVCLEGQRACPPEDGGGPLGYEDLLAVLADPGHPDHEDFKEWVPPDFDPDFFDIEEANVGMRSPRPPAGW